MKMVIKANKTEIRTTEEEKKIKINRNKYDIESYIISGYDFYKWLNNIHSKQKEYKWIKEVSSKAVKQAIMNGDKSFKRFFKKQASFPRFKRRSDYGSFYLI